MTILRQFMMSHGARTDARFGLDSAEERIVAALGPRPKLGPGGNPEHAGDVRALAERVKIDETKEDITAAEDAYAKHAPPFLFTAGLAGALGVEGVGST